MPDPFTIRIFVPDGDPESLLLIDRLNWTGLGLSFSRTKWSAIGHRPELQNIGVYILWGHPESDNALPKVYVGQADDVKVRIDQHLKEKDFWHRATAFVSTNRSLNRAHVTWLEYALIKLANEAKQCALQNGVNPQEPTLSEAEKADTKSFLSEILQILPLINIRSFEKPKGIIVPGKTLQPSTSKNEIQDTIIVPAQKEGFEEAFLGEDCWYAIRISGGRLNEIRYIAAYQTQPLSAITHFAHVDRIEPFGDESKYKIVFQGSAQSIGPIKRGDAPPGSMQSIRYTSYQKLRTAKTLLDLF